HDTIVPALPGTWESHHIFAPFVFKWHNQFHMIYTGINRNLYECLGYASSSDLFTWQRNTDPIIDPHGLSWAHADNCPDIDTRELSPCRDPHVYVEDDTMYLYYSAKEKDTGLPVVGVSTSSDGQHWQDAGVAFRGWDNSFDCLGLLESSCVHKLDSGRYLLTFNTRGCVRYVIADNPLDFNGCQYHDLPTEENYISLELVNRHTDKWLVAYFGGKAGFRMSLGTLEWDGDQVLSGKRINSQSELLDFTRPIGK
ncbi:MAG: hypothetical protein HRU15_11950, partial [Planctomycetes bacterium]|nr:hypothetical protein [Planctomycetota bacterium]